MKSFKLALIQMHITGGNKPKNLAKAEEMLRESANKGADLALLPETMNLGWTDPSARTDADSIPGSDSCEMLIKAARQYGIYICSGLVEKTGGRVYNSAIIISSRGDIILHHQKLNELEIGHDYYAQGSKLNVCRTELGTLGLMICSDAFAEGRVLSQALCYMGADIILSPGSWAVPPGYDNTKEPCGKIWHGHYRPVAKKFSVWIAGVSNVGIIKAGPWRGHSCIGNSLVVDPNGTVTVEGPYGVDAETILYTTITLVRRPARGNSWARYLKDKNLPENQFY